MQITQLPSLTEAEWYLVRTRYEKVTAEVVELVDKLDRNTDMFTSEQLDHVHLLFSSIERHGYLATVYTNSELNRRDS